MKLEKFNQTKLSAAFQAIVHARASLRKHEAEMRTYLQDPPDQDDSLGRALHDQLGQNFAEALAFLDAHFERALAHGRKVA